MKSKGTNVYIIDPSDGTTVITLGCPTSLSDLGGKRSTEKTDCLDAGDATVELGSIEYNGSKIPLRLNTGNTSHKKVYDIFKSYGSDVWFAIGLSDGTAAPTVQTGAWATFSNTRTYIAFQGGVSEWGLSFDPSSPVNNDITVQVCSNFSISWKSGS